MAIKNVNPYLNLDGTAAQAIELYEQVFDVKAENRSTFGEVGCADMSPEAARRIMHARLRVGPGLIMISDTRPGDPAPTDGNVHVCVDFDDVDDMRRRFDLLAAGGKVRLPPQDTFWGATFGMLTDAYGIHWMFNCEKKS